MQIIRRILHFKIDQRVVDGFIETGEVDDIYLRVICFKIIKNQELNELESIIFHGKTKEINELIIDITKSID